MRKIPSWQGQMGEESRTQFTPRSALDRTVRLAPPPLHQQRAAVVVAGQRYVQTSYVAQSWADLWRRFAPVQRVSPPLGLFCCPPAR